MPCILAWASLSYKGHSCRGEKKKDEQCSASSGEPSIDDTCTWGNRVVGNRGNWVVVLFEATECVRLRGYGVVTQALGGIQVDVIEENAPPQRSIEWVNFIGCLELWWVTGSCHMWLM